MEKCCTGGWIWTAHRPWSKFKRLCKDDDDKEDRDVLNSDVLLFGSTIKSNSTEDFCKTCLSQVLPVLDHWRAWASPRGLGWYQSSWIQDVQGGPLKEAALVAQESQGTLFLCTAGNLEIIHNRGRVYLVTSPQSHSRQRRRMKMLCFIPSTSLSLEGKPVPRASCSHPLPQNTMVWGFRHSQGLWKPPLGCAPILSKHFKDTNEVSCLLGSMSQSDKNWNKTPNTKEEERGRKCCEAQRAEDVGTAGLNCLLLCCARQNVPGTALLTFGLLLVVFFYNIISFPQSQQGSDIKQAELGFWGWESRRWSLAGKSRCGFWSPCAAQGHEGPQLG